MAKGIREIICPECEGFGRAVNYFDPPQNRHMIGVYAPRIYEKDDRCRRSDGRLYEDYECSVCHGNGRILVMFPWEEERRKDEK